MKVHLPVQYPEVHRPQDSMASHGCEWSQKYLYTPTQAGKQSRTDCFTQTSRYNSWLRTTVRTIVKVDNPHTAESTSYLYAWQSQVKRSPHQLWLKHGGRSECDTFHQLPEKSQTPKNLDPPVSYHSSSQSDPHQPPFEVSTNTAILCNHRWQNRSRKWAQVCTQPQSQTLQVRSVQSQWHSYLAATT